MIASEAVTVVLLADLGVNANQIHKWNHRYRSDAPLSVRLLQHLRVLRSPRQHAQHHRDDKNTRYCVITEVLNPLLDWTSCRRALLH